MVQILAIIPGALFGILAGLFGTVARIYDILLTLTGYYKDGGAPDNLIITTSNVMTTMYTLAGVFMLFRVTVSMINMLVDPDKVNDRQTGPGKLVTRIITSIAMLIIFVPTGWVFNKNPDDPGILMRIEKALLAEDGLINNLMPEVAGEKEKLSELNKIDLFIDNVNAVPASDRGDTSSSGGYSCYYIKVNNSKEGVAQKTDGTDDGPTSKSATTISGVMHLTFYGDKTTGKNKLYTPNYHFSYTSDSTEPFTDRGNKALEWDALKDTWPSSYNCPNYISEKLIGYDTAEDAGADDWYKPGNAGWYGGWHSLETMKSAVSARNSTVNVVGNDPTKTNQIRSLLGLTGEWLYGVSEEAVNFAQSALSSFIECNGSDENCDVLKAGMLLSKSGNDAVADELNNDNSTMQLDFIVGLVAGLGLVVWITVLCVEVIIRRFKLILLEIISPIPIIAYSDPKDETFSKWLKMYVSIYLELFLKLIAIAFAIALLKQVRYAVDGSGLLMFFYIVAILLFAKMIPDMISKIFGIDISSGSFKDIIGMGKRVLGTGAGAIGRAGATLAVGATAVKAAGSNIMNKDKLNKLKQDAAAGDLDAKKKLAEHDKKVRQERAMAAAMTGASTFASFFKGAAAGSQGKLSGVVTAAKDGAAIQAERRKKFASGLSPTDLIAAGTLGKVGMDYASRVDREVAQDIERKEVADDVPKILDVPFAAYKKSGFAMTLDSLLKNGAITGNQHKTLTKDYLDWQSTLLENAYGEYDEQTQKLTGRLDVEKIENAVGAGTITAARAMDILMNDAKFQAAMHGAMAEGQQKNDYMKLHISLLGEAYGEVGANGELTGKLDESKLLQAVNDGTITGQEANDILIKDAEFQAAINGRSGLDSSLDGDVKMEIGIQNTLATAFDTVNAKKQGSGYYADAIGNPENDIVDFNGLDAAVNASYATSKDLSAEINAKTVGDPKYVTSKAANQSAGNDKK